MTEPRLRPFRPGRPSALTLALVSSLILASAIGPGVRAADDDLDAAETALREALLDRWVLVRIDMPAHEDGIDLRLWQEPAIDVDEYQTRIAKYGVSIPAYGQQSRITDIRRRRKHLEVHLNGGGYSGRVPRMPWSVDRSAEEIALRLPARPEPADEIRRRTAELAEARAREDDQAYVRYLEEMVEYERDKVLAGSRFNVRYPNRLTVRELTPESVRSALRPYVDFLER